MANALYDNGRQRFLGGTIGWNTDDIRIGLIDGASYTPDLANHDFLDDIPGGARTALSDSLDNPTITAGVADADNETWASVGAGPANEYIACYVHTGTDATAALIFLIDTATNLPVTPNGGDITVQWSDGADRIFRL